MQFGMREVRCSGERVSCMDKRQPEKKGIGIREKKTNKAVGWKLMKKPNEQ